MKLVGATNSFVRLPFMLEGMLTGLLGALGALVMLGVVYIALNGYNDGLTDPVRLIGIPQLMGLLAGFGLILARPDRASPCAASCAFSRLGRRCGSTLSPTGEGAPSICVRCDRPGAGRIVCDGLRAAVAVADDAAAAARRPAHDAAQ